MTGSAYIRWAKSRERFRYNIGRSSIRPCPLEALDPRPEDYTLHGPNAHGWGPLREAIGERYEVEPSRVTLAIGTSMANHLACAALLRPGDHVLVEIPGYEPLRQLPRYFGCEVECFERRAAEQWRLDAERCARLVGGRTRLIVLSDLHNPTGAKADPESLEALARLAEENDLYLLVDEVYLEFVHGSGALPAARASDRILSTCSLTKAYGLDGLRAGWVLSSGAMAERIRRLNDLFGIIMPHPSERLAHRALLRADSLGRSVAALVSENRRRVEALVERRHELSWTPPAAGPVGFVRLRGVAVDALVDLLESEYDATLPPGRFFGAADHFRIAFGMETEDLEAGLERLEAALDRLGPVSPQEEDP